MGHLQTNTDLPRIFSEYLLVRNNDKTGGIGLRLVNAPLQNIQSVDFGRLLTGYGRLRPVPLPAHLTGGKGIVFQADLFPVLMRAKISGALHQRLGMGIHRPDL